MKDMRGIEMNVGDIAKLHTEDEVDIKLRELKIKVEAQCKIGGLQISQVWFNELNECKNKIKGESTCI